MALKHFGPGSEYRKLTSVLLYRPGPEVGSHPDPVAIQHLAAIDYTALSLEFDHIINTFAGLGIEVIQIDASPLGEDRLYLHNLMYCRDLFFMTPEGVIISNMADRVRRDEALYAARALRMKGIPVLHTVSDRGTFEGADALWVNEKLVMIGVGNRTNEEACRQIRDVLKRMDIECVAVPFRQKGPQHLLGALQVVDRDLALVRYEIIDKEAVRILEEQKFTIIRVPENPEVRTRQAMNIVTVAPRTVLMTAGCPQTKEIYLKAGLNIAAELELAQLMNGAGGLACATGIIARG